MDYVHLNHEEINYCHHSKSMTKSLSYKSLNDFAAFCIIWWQYGTSIETSNAPLTINEPNEIRKPSHGQSATRKDVRIFLDQERPKSMSYLFSVIWLPNEPTVHHLVG